MNEPDILIPFTRITPKNCFRPTLVQFHSMLYTSLSSILFMVVNDLKYDRSKKHRVRLYSLSNPLKASFIFWVGSSYLETDPPQINIAVNTRVGSTVLRLDVTPLVPYVMNEENLIPVADSDMGWMIAKAILEPLIDFNRYRDMDQATSTTLANFLAKN